MEDITDADYKHEKRVCKDFNVKNLCKYCGLHVQSDTLLLADAPFPLLSAGGGGVGWGERPTKFSKRGGLTGSQFLEGGCRERWGDLFRRGLQFLHKKSTKT